MLCRVCSHNPRVSPVDCQGCEAFTPLKSWSAPTFILLNQIPEPFSDWKVLLHNINMQVLLHVVLYKQDEHILSAHSRSISLKE